MRIRRAPLLLAVAAASALLLSGCGALATPAPTSTSATQGTDWEAQALVESADGTVTPSTYHPIDVADVAPKLTLCVLFPNVADDYWAAVNYGSLAEAQRDGVTYAAYQAGGYENLQTQLDQIDSCITQHTSAIVIGAISNGACSGVEKAIAAGIPVVDFINGMSCPSVEGNRLFSHVYIGGVDLGNAAADMLIASDKKLSVGLFPGPDGAAFADIQSKAIEDRLAGSKVTVDAVRRGDLSEDVQLTLVEDVLRTYPKINAVLGITAAGSAGATAVRNAGRDDVSVYQYAITPSFYDDIRSGSVAGSVSDLAPITARMGVDQAVRMASGADTFTGVRIGPKPLTITAKNIDSVNRNDLFAPRGFELTYNWAPQG
jgi:periplasmic protein TorT